MDTMFAPKERLEKRWSRAVEKPLGYENADRRKTYGRPL